MQFKRWSINITDNIRLLWRQLDLYTERVVHVTKTTSAAPPDPS